MSKRQRQYAHGGTRRSATRGIAAAVVPMLLTTGCATTPVPQIEARYYGQCVKPLVRMQEADNRLARTTAQSALGGALAGAVIGLVVTASNPYALPVGIGVGAAAGAAVGAGVGYSFAKLDQIADENTRFASIRITANQDLSKANRLQLYCYESMTCYLREFDALKTSYEQGNLPQEEYRNRFSEIYAAMQTLGRIIGRMDAEITRTEGEFNASVSRRPSVAAPVTSQPAEVARQTPRPRSSQHLVASLAERRSRVKKAQEKNEADLTAMLEECVGKVTPPKQNVAAIRHDYGNGYAETRREIDELRSTLKATLAIMDEAAFEAGIDMV